MNQIVHNFLENLPGFILTLVIVLLGVITLFIIGYKNGCSSTEADDDIVPGSP